MSVSEPHDAGAPEPPESRGPREPRGSAGPGEPRAEPGTLQTVTSTSLLEGLCDPDNRTVWLDFVERYRPLVVGYGRRAGLANDDAEDLAQQSLLAFSEAYRDRKYERARGRLRDWLFGIVGNQLKNLRRARARRAERFPETRSGAAFDVPSENELERLWEDEWQDAVARECLAQVRREVSATTFRAFELYALGDRSADEVARELDLSADAVYGAKRRILRRIRDLQPFVEDVF